MKKLIYATKMYDYSNKEQAQKDIPEMRKTGWIVKQEYQAEKTYVVEYYKDCM